MKVTEHALADAVEYVRDDTRARIVHAAAELLNTGGREALTTRAIAGAAGVQAPTIYRLFGDKSGLLDALAEHGFATYLAGKELGEEGVDPVADLRAGWDLHVGFGLANPAIYALMYGDPRPGVTSPAAAAGYEILKQRIHAIAVAGRLRLPEARAAELVHAGGSGTVFSLLAVAEDARDLGLSEAAREAVIAAITTDVPAVPAAGPAASAIALRAVLPDATSLSEGERHLLDEWLARLAEQR